MADQFVNLAFVDTETTGLDPDQHEIWEVGLILRTDAGDTEHSWQLPVDLGRADPMGLRIGQFHDRRWAGDGWSPNDTVALTYIPKFAWEFAKLTNGAHLVGAVISFDEERLRRLLRANQQCPMWHYHLIDVEALAAGYLMGAGAGTGGEVARKLPWSSDNLSSAVGVKPEDFDRHTALGDARWARAIYDAVVTE